MASRLERSYRYYNRRYFGNLLPNPPEVRVHWARLQSELGYQLEDEIVLNRRYRHCNALWRMTLLHEMVHLKLPPRAPDHGRRFQREMLRLARAGAFRYLW